MIEGRIADGFESVVAEFEANFQARGDVGAAFCATLNGEVVVDIWAGLRDVGRGIPWAKDTLVGVFSGGKGLVASCLLLLIERGALELEKPVAHYWPEFASAGKENILVRHIVSHQAGLPGLETAVTAEEATDFRRMAGLLAAQTPICQPGEMLYYHALTFGWLCGELILRIDGRTVGQLFRDEIATPLSLDAWIGLPEQDDARVAHLERGATFGSVIGSGHSEVELDDLTRWSIWENPPRFAVDPLPANCRFWRAAEVPGSNAVATARSLARLYGCLAQGGEIDGVRVFETSTIQLAAVTLGAGRDPFLDRELAFGVGFQTGGKPSPFEPEEMGFGHPGAGGSVHGAWPRLGASFSYTTNTLLETGSHDLRSQSLLGALHRCLLRE